jgi:hypothetical protein
MIEYPPVEQRRSVLQRRLGPAGQAVPEGRRDVVLREVVERVPFDAARAYFLETKQDGGEIVRAIDRVRTLHEDEAPGFLRQARQGRKTGLLCLGLFALRTQALQADAADALAELADPVAVRSLAVRLNLARGIVGGGSESKHLNDRLKASLAKAIGASAGIDTSRYDGGDAATQALLDRCRAWLAARPDPDAP